MDVVLVLRSEARKFPCIRLHNGDDSRKIENADALARVCSYDLRLKSDKLRMVLLFWIAIKIVVK